MVEIDVSSQIKILRTKLNLTQEELALKAEIPYTTLAKIENGNIKNPTIKKVYLIAKALNVSLDALITIKSYARKNSTTSRKV